MYPAKPVVGAGAPPDKSQLGGCLQKGSNVVQSQLLTRSDFNTFATTRPTWRTLSHGGRGTGHEHYLTPMDWGKQEKLTFFFKIGSFDCFACLGSNRLLSAFLAPLLVFPPLAGHSGKRVCECIQNQFGWFPDAGKPRH